MCALWEKLGERPSLATWPESNESLSQMRRLSAASGSAAVSPAAWGRAVATGFALYWILT